MDSMSQALNIAFDACGRQLDSRRVGKSAAGLSFRSSANLSG